MNINFSSKKVSLFILGITAIICSRMVFVFFADSEGPNLLIVGGLATILFMLSITTYEFVLPKTQAINKLLVTVGVQILSATIIYFFMR